MNKQEYAKCIEDDIDFLKRHLPESLFRCLWTSHIIEVLKASINMIYDRPSLPSDLDEAAVDYANRFATDAIDHELLKGHFKGGAEWHAGQGYTRECTVDRTPLNGPAGICLNLHEYDGFKLGDKVIVQIRKKD